MNQDQLREYIRKRNFEVTPEPAANQGKKTAKPIWVIQKHDASNLHYDFRLEVDGVLKSWAVPKGPSTDPSEKRLALPTEDHPVEYAQFEGVIPADEYGGGTVMIWDTGTYRNLKAEIEAEDEREPMSMTAAYDAGHLSVYLEDGQKIAGGYTLVRTGSSKDSRWLLIKIADDQADARRNPVSTEPDSVVSRRSLAEIAADDNDKGDDEA